MLNRYLFTLAMSLVFTPVLWAQAPRPSGNFLPNLETNRMETRHVRRAPVIDFVFNMQFEPGMGLNASAPSRYHISASGIKPAGIELEDLNGSVNSNPVRVSLGIPSELTEFVAQFEATIFYCKKEGSSVCYIKSYAFIQPVHLADDATGSEIQFSADVEVPH